MRSVRNDLGQKSDGTMIRGRLRSVLIVVTAVLAFALIVSFAKQGAGSSLHDDDYSVQMIQLRKLNQPFSWHDDAELPENDEAENDANVTRTVSNTCRNSIQGKILIADDKGYTCHRSDLLGTGCCHPNASSTVRYACRDCHEASGCCKVYEHCISCCMDPTKKPILMNVLSEANALKNILLLSVSDHFELCLAKCRTSSSSVQHENVYINPANKFCYMKGPPSTDAT